MRLFKRQGVSFSSIPCVAFSDNHLERHLEDWVESCSSLVGDLLVLGRQIRTERNKPMDLLALDSNGDAVIIELKRAEGPRELVGQVADYLSSVRRWTARDLEKHANPTLSPWSLPKTFQEKFKREPPEDFNRNQRVIVMVESIDDETLDQLMTIREVEVITFSYFKDNDSEYVLVRDRHNAVPPPPSGGKPQAPRKPKESEHSADDIAWFFERFNKAEPLLSRDVFRPKDGWRCRKRPDEPWVTYSCWDKNWLGFVIAFSHDEDNKRGLCVGVQVRPEKHAPLLLEKFRRDEALLRSKLGNDYELSDNDWWPISELIPGDDPSHVAERLAAYKAALVPYLNEVLGPKEVKA